MQEVKIFLITFAIVILTESVPITSKALGTSNDQFIWQQAWYAVDPSNQTKTPYNGNSKKISAKSIFITPYFHNLSQSYCPPGFKIDERGQCIQIVNINQGKLVEVREKLLSFYCLQFISQMIM